MSAYTNNLEDQIIRLQNLLKDVILDYELTCNVGESTIEKIKEEMDAD